MTIDPNTLGAVVGAGIQNVVHQTVAQTLETKGVVVGGWDETTYPGLTPNVIHKATSPEQVAAETGEGFILHRLALAYFKGSAGATPFAYIPVGTDVGGVQATGTLTITGTSIGAGTLHLYIGNDYVPTTVQAGDTPTEIGDNVVTAVTAKPELPVTAANLAGVVTFTAKDAFLWGNEIPININWLLDQVLPENLTAVIVAMSGGAGASNMDDALGALGVGDQVNADHYTELAHCWGKDPTALAALSSYNGTGDEFTGLYAKPVARPLRSAVGDNVTGLSNLQTFVDSYRLDRTTAVFGLYGVPEHPQETAAKILGLGARINAQVGSEHYTGRVIPETLPSSTTDTSNWTNYQTNRDNATKTGIGTVYVQDGAVKIANWTTMYRPASVPVSSNIYRDGSSLSKIRNILAAHKAAFAQPKYQGVYIVADKTKVTSIVDHKKAIDLNDVKSELVTLAFEYEKKGWIFSAEYVINRLTTENLVVVRAGGSGFDTQFPVYLSTPSSVYNNEILADLNISVLFA